MIIDATDLILGRMAAFAAKKSLLGERVDIVNCEKAVISGNKRFIFGKYKHKYELGRNPYKGPFYPKMPDSIVRRTIRGMLPWKNKRGREAYKRVMCYIGVPERFKNQKFEELKEAHVSKLPHLKFTRILELSKQLGAKI